MYEAVSNDIPIGHLKRFIFNKLANQPIIFHHYPLEPMLRYYLRKILLAMNIGYVSAVVWKSIGHLYLFFVDFSAPKV